MFNSKIRCCTFLQAYISIFIFFLILPFTVWKFLFTHVIQNCNVSFNELENAHSFITPTIIRSSSTSYYFTLTIISRWVVPAKLQWKHFKIWFSLPGFIRYIWFELRFAFALCYNCCSVLLDVDCTQSTIRGSITNTYSIAKKNINMLIKSESCYSYTSFCNLAKKKYGYKSLLSDWQS